MLKFWFVKGTDYLDKVTGAYEFFKELVKPDSFPRGTYPTVDQNILLFEKSR